MTVTYVMDTDRFLDSRLFQRAFSAMPGRRKEKILRFRFERDRRLSLGAGVLLDYGLSLRGLRLRDVTLSLGPNEKPFLAGRDDLHFSLSHSGARAACAISERAVGVDLEQCRPVSPSLCRGVTTGEELAYLLRFPEGPAREREFFRLWTAKESYLKYLGTGLSLPPREIALCLAGPVSLRASEAVFFREYRLGDYQMTVCGASDRFAPEPVPLPEAWLARYPNLK